MNEKEKSSDGLRLIDIIVVIIFLLLASLFVYLFYNDLTSTLASKNQKPVGTIIIKSNIVQRRLADRVVWDRLFSDSPVYSGDLIRVAENSAANLNIEDASIDLEENTLVRIMRAYEGDGSFRIEVNGGGINLDTGKSGANFTLDLNGSEVHVGPGAVVNAASGENGLTLKVIEGQVQFVSSGESRSVSSGSIVSMDANGAQRTVPAVIMRYPAVNARYLKSGTASLPVNFSWQRINLSAGAPLRLEVASDRNFNVVSYSTETDASSVSASFNTGSWFWRISYDSDILSSGVFTVTDGSGVELISPVMNSVFNYGDEPPQVRFQWTEADEALYYILEVSETPGFSNPRISRQAPAAFFADSTLAQGTYYWRVQPVFPSLYEGGGSFTSAVSFRIEQNNNIEGTQVSVAPPVVEEPPPPAPVPPPAPAPAPRPAPAPTPAPRPAPAPVLLAAPANLTPPAGYRIGLEEIQAQRDITFRWAAVVGADAYIFSIYEQTANGRRQVLSSEPENSTNWTLDNLRLLGRGSFIWQVEAVRLNRNGTIAQRGRIGENTFTIDVPYAGPVQIDDVRIYYGN